MRLRDIGLALAACLLAGRAVAAPADGSAPVAGAIVVDDFESVAAWSAHPADGVELAIASDSGAVGRAMRLDVRFPRGSGYAVARRAVNLDLPENWRFRFVVRGTVPPEHLEFKLIDASGDNVWWQVRRDMTFPQAWTPLSVRKKNLQFAWGPAGGGDIRHVAAIEIAITAGSGGAGSVWLDELVLEPMPEQEQPPMPKAFASSSRSGRDVRRALDSNTATAWEPASSDRSPSLTLDLGTERELASLILNWLPKRAPVGYVVESSGDRKSWKPVREVKDGDGGRDGLWLDGLESRYLRVRVTSAGKEGVALAELEVEPLESSTSLSGFFMRRAQAAPRGSYPRGMIGEQSYWAVVGADGSREEMLLSEDGALELSRGGPSIEPFLFTGGRLLSWADAKIEHSLEGGSLPLPVVTWKIGTLELRVAVLARGDSAASSGIARYVLRNRGRRPAAVTLFLGLRPFQVNPPSQTLNLAGGVAPVPSIRREAGILLVGGKAAFVSLTPPSTFGASTFDHGDAVDFLRRGRVPDRSDAEDTFGHASGAMAYALQIPPGSEREVDVWIPIAGEAARPPGDELAAHRWVEQATKTSRDTWAGRDRSPTLTLPASAGEVTRSLWSQLGWILVNRDGPAIQPGSRAYERSWIRDGSLTSSALMRLGRDDVARQYAEWYATQLYDNGKVPCCVDRRGPDPVPENDSGGEFIWLVAEIHRMTGDRAFTQRMWPAVARAAAYLDTLRQQRRTPEWHAPERAEFFGLLPPSISHEGYSAKPMHSYWDDFFALRGFRDVAWLATAFGTRAEAARWAAVRDTFQHDLLTSIERAMARHKIDYIPGCADLGDFDATSTTIALAPGGLERTLPRKALERTFERWWEFFRARRDTIWDAYTPYEMRAIGAFVRLGWRDRANELLDWYLKFRRPAGWAQWAEVVAREERTPRFLGDMPHTWVGSDYVRSVLDMLAWERESDDALVIGAGVPMRWIAEDPGVIVESLPTRWGKLGYRMRKVGESIEVRIDGGLSMPKGGVIVDPPGLDRFREVHVHGGGAVRNSAGEIVVKTVPSTVLISPSRGR